MPLGIVHDLAVGVHPLGRRRLGAAATRWPAGSPWARRPTSSTSSARTGASRPGGPTGSPSSATRRSATWCAPCCATRAASGSTTSSACSGSGGSRPAARRPRAPTCTTTTRRCSASSCSRRSGPARSSSARTSAWWPRTCATTWPSAGWSAPRSCGSSGRTTAPKPPEHYRELCLATVTTHDLPPSAGYLSLEHVAIREQLGLLTRPVEEERAQRGGLDRAAAGRERRAWAARLRPPASTPSSRRCTGGWR